MHKILKWIYNLGVQHERARISSHLQIELARMSQLREVLNRRMSDTNDPYERFSTQCELQFLNKSENLIGSLYKKEEMTTRYKSIMYPGDDIDASL